MPIIGTYKDYVEVAVTVCVLLAALPSILNRMAPLDWMFLTGCLGFYLLNFAVFPDNHEFLVEYMYATLCLAVPFFIFGRVLDVQAYIKPITTISALCIILDALYMLTYMREPEQLIGRTTGTYYMGYAYRLLPHVMLIGWSCMKDFRIWKFLLSILGIMLILSYGSRGPLLCLGVFFTIIFFFFARFKRSFEIKSTFVALCGIGLVFKQSILLFLRDTLSSIDMSTRIVERMLTGGITHDTGRTFIKVRLYELLEKPDAFWGYGLFGSMRFDIVYPHDYKLDFLFSYGYLIGSILLLLTSYIMIKAIIVARTSIEREFTIMLICMTIIRFQVSYTYLWEGMYFALLGYCTTILINHKYSQNTPCQQTMLPNK